MNFKDYLKKNNIVIEHNKSPYRLERFFKPYLNTYVDLEYKFVTTEDAERLNVILDYLKENPDVNNRQFLEMVENIEGYNETVQKYPYLYHFVDDLRDTLSVNAIIDTIENIGKLNEKMNKLDKKSENNLKNIEKTIEIVEIYDDERE